MSFINLTTERERAMEAAFRDESTPHSYRTYRGLYTDGAIVPKGGYRELLSTFRGKNIIQLIDSKVMELEGIRPAYLLDVGCGTGRFLVDCFERWSTQVKPEGITAHRYNLVVDETQGTAYDITDLIDIFGIKITQGDAQRLTDYYPKNHFDVATAVFVTRYLADPWAMIQGMHEVLRIGGEGRVMPFSPNFRRTGSSRLLEYLQDEKGWQVDTEGARWQLAFEKTTDSLDLPIKVDFVENGQVFYRTQGI